MTHFLPDIINKSFIGKNANLLYRVRKKDNYGNRNNHFIASEENERDDAKMVVYETAA